MNIPSVLLHNLGPFYTWKAGGTSLNIFWASTRCLSISTFAVPTPLWDDSEWIEGDVLKVLG